MILFFLQDYFTTNFKKSELYPQTFGKAASESGISGYGTLEGLIRVVDLFLSFFYVKYPKSEDLTFNFVIIQSPTRGCSIFNLFYSKMWHIQLLSSPKKYEDNEAPGT